MLLIRKATIDDIEQFVITISDSDLAEMEAQEPNRDLKEVLLSHLTEDTVVCVDSEGYIYAFGGNVGNCVWFLTSSGIEDASLKVKMEFQRQIVGYRDKMLSLFPCLFNYVWVGNDAHIKFLKSLGAKFHDEYNHSEFTGESFRLFTMEGAH